MSYFLPMVIFWINNLPLGQNLYQRWSSNKGMPSATSQILVPAATRNIPAAAVVKVPAALPKKIRTNRMFTISMFVLMIVAKGGIVIWASKKTRTASEYYATGGGISGIQNGWAIAVCC